MDTQLTSELQDATIEGNLELCLSLLRNGCDVSFKDQNGESSLHLAALFGRTEIAKVLIEYGADVAAKDINGETPLHYAVLNGHSLVASVLLDSGADVNAKAYAEPIYDGRAPIHNAARQRVNEPPDAENQINRPGMSGAQSYEAILALHDNMSAAKTCTIELLLDSGASIDEIDTFGRSALHLAAQEDVHGVAAILLERGADPSLLDSDGNRASEIARNKNKLFTTGKMDLENFEVAELKWQHDRAADRRQELAEIATAARPQEALASAQQVQAKRQAYGRAM